MDRLKIIIAEELITLCEVYLGIDAISKDSSTKSMKSQEYWALFAHLYEDYFSQVNTKEDVEDLTEKLMSQTNNSRVMQAILYFADLRTNEI